MNFEDYLSEHPYVDYSAENIRQCRARLFEGARDEMEKARRAYYFVRDEIPHSFDCQARVITARASEVLELGTGICHAKANLLAALLRGQGLPAGFCFQRLTLAEDDSLGHVLHAFNAVYLEGGWRKLDARGNKKGIQADFTLDSPSLAYPRCRPEYGEYFWEGIYAAPDQAAMKVLDQSRNLQDVLDRLPDRLDSPEERVRIIEP